MDSEDGQLYVKNLAHFVRTHEKALANALQLRRQAPASKSTGQSTDGVVSPVSSYQTSTSKPSAPSSLASVLTLGALGSSSHNEKAAKLSLTPHHLYYLLCKIEEIGIQVGPMGVRLENIHANASPANYVSFLNQSHRSKNRSDRDSIHSVSSMRSVMSGMSSLWSGFGLRSSNSAARTEKAKVQMLTDLKYLYSAFTKIPCLRLSPDHNARLIGGYEEFPFDTAVPLWAFKNVSSLEISDVDFRQFYGWDKLSEQLRSLTVKRAQLNDLADLLTSIVLDDMDKRRRRSSRTQHTSPPLPWPASPSVRFNEPLKSPSNPSSPFIDDKLSQSTSPQKTLTTRGENGYPSSSSRARNKSSSPTRPGSSSRNSRSLAPRIKRSGSASSNSSTHSSGPYRNGSSSNLLNMSLLPVSKWRQLRHLSLADNSLTTLTASSLAPLTNTLHSLDLSSNLFTEIPDSIGSLPALQSLNMSNCMLESLHSLKTQNLPSITVLSLRSNRLPSLAGIECLNVLERLDIRDNQIADPVELARLTGDTAFREVWVSRNPFVKTHANHRITIFNLFRDAPGFSADLSIDSTGPGYNERRQLRDRAAPVEQPQTEIPTVDKEPRPSLEPTTVPPKMEPSTPRQSLDDNLMQRPEPRSTHSEFTVGSSRKKKGTRRRIVDLARAQSPDSHETESSLAGSPRHASAEAPSTVRMVDSEPDVLPSPTATGGPESHSQQRRSVGAPPPPQFVTSQVSDYGRSLAAEIPGLAPQGETYRQKVEALKAEVGSNWLSVLSEQRWNGQQAAERDFPPYPPSAYAAREGIPVGMPNQSILSGSRTLG